MKFVDNDRLAWLIFEYIVACDYLDSSKVNIENVLDWLKLSSSVDSITIDTAKYDNAIFYCGTALDYENAKSSLMSFLTTELVRFHFAWGALESLVTEFIPPKKIEQFGKINALCGYLKKSNLKDLLPTGYIEEYYHLVELMEKTFQYTQDINAIVFPTTIGGSKKNHIDSVGIGVYSVYRIRNKFAHGSMVFPEPEDYGDGAELNKELIVVATRIVLMTIIMLLVNDVKNDDFVLDPEEFRFIKYFVPVSYEYSLINQLGGHSSAFHKVTAVRYLRNLCIDRIYRQ